MGSDEKSVLENLAAYDVFFNYLKETSQIPADEQGDYLIAEETRHLFVLRVQCYNNPEIDLDDIRTDYGTWDDNAILAL